MEHDSFSEGNFKSLITNPFDKSIEKYTIEIGWNKSFESLIFNENISLNEGEEYEHTIIFNKSTFKKIIIDGAKFSELLWFKNCSFEDDFIIYDGDLKTLIFDNCDFKTGFIIYNVNIERLAIENSTSKNPILIKGGVFQKVSYTAHDEKTHLKINGQFTFINLFNINTVIGATITISESIIRLLKLEGDYNSSSRINFKKIKNLDVSLDNVNNDGKLYLTNFETYDIIGLKLPPLDNVIKNISDEETKDEILHFIKYNPKIKTFLQLYNHISLRQDYKNHLYFIFFRDIIVTDINSPQPTFAIKYSSLGQLELKGMKLERYNLIIMSSDLSSIKLINSTFPTDQQAWTYSDGFSIFNDLYTSASKQNNTEDKIEYYKASQKYLYKKIKYSKTPIKPSYPALKVLSQKTGSMIAINTSGLYSDHGSSWIRAAIITVFVIGLPLFGLYTYSLKDIQLDLSSKGILFYFNDILPYFPQFLNPLHKLEFMDSISTTESWSGLTDLMGRILIGIGIFEMIRSFRKYVRT